MNTTPVRRLLPILLACATLAGSARADDASVRALSTAIDAAGSTPYREAVAAYLEGKAPKIVGGELARIADYPWQVSLGVSWIADPFKAHFCGGSVYSTRWIVTAAHCVRNTAARDIVVSAGTDKLGQGGVRRNVRRIIVNANYVDRTKDNDIALMELMDPVPLGTAIQPISLMSPDEEVAWLKNVEPLTTVGWGATQEGGGPVRDLRHVKVAHVEPKPCNSPLAYDGKITANMVCAGDLRGGKDSCQGDSGGPLSTSLQGQLRLLGVVSWGHGCARPGLVGVYTRVPNYAGWINACVANGGACN